MRKLLIIAVSIATLFATALPVFGNTARTPERVSGEAVRGPVDLDEVVRLFVRLDVPAVSEFVAESNNTPNRGQQQAQANKVKAQQNAKKGDIEAAGGTIVDSLVVGANGFHIDAALRAIPDLASIDGVLSVARVTEFEVSNESSVPWIGAPAVWELGYTGEGVSVGIIDTGIDYYHANFGGSGDVNDYLNDDPTIIEAGTFPTAKVAGGWDFAGDNYDASGDDGPTTPSPDADPLDCHGHGSHVGGSAAGVGVPGIIGKGVAPDATVYALKVFGCSGSTNVTSQAIEWAMDPNGDGSMDDHLDVINMSLGSPFGSHDDPSTISSNNAAAAGVIVVASAGNEGDSPYVTGSPGVADGAINVAASVDGGYAVLALEYAVDGGAPVQVEAAEGGFTPPLALVGPVSGVVVEAQDAVGDSNDGCTALTNGADIAGNIALIERGACAFVDKVANAEAAGAIGVIVFNDAARGDAVLVMGGSGTFTIPSMFVGHSDGQAMADAYNAGSTVTATLSSDIRIPKPELADTLADFTSRGPGFGTTFKPDVAAPGFGILSTNVGTGVLGSVSSGTSMAAPHVAGLAALLVDKHGDLDPVVAKALIQNSTTPAAVNYPLARQGVGIVQADAAIGLTSYASPGGVSFGRIDSTNPTSIMMDVTVTNMSSTSRTFSISTVPLHTLPGVTVETTEDTVTVGANSSATFKAHLSANPNEMAADNNFFSQSEVDGWFILNDGTDELHVGYMAAADPASNIEVSVKKNGVTAKNNASVPGVAEGFAYLGTGLLGDGEPYNFDSLGVRAHDAYGFNAIEFGVATDAAWQSFSPYEIDIYIDDDPDTACGPFGAETVIVAADLGLLLGNDPTGTIVTGVFNLCTGAFPLDFFSGMDYNDEVGVLLDEWELVFPYDGDGVFNMTAYSFDYYSSNFDVMQASVDTNTAPSADPFSFALENGVLNLSTSGSGDMLWLYPANERGDQSQVVTLP